MTSLSSKFFHAAGILLLVLPSALSAQTKSGRPVSPLQQRSSHREVLEGTYTVVPPERQKYSPSYQLTTPGFFMTQVNVSGTGQNIVGDAANEPSIAVDPTNSNRMAIGWRQFNTASSNFRQAGYGYTTDGGHTWTFPGVIEPGVFRSDPVLDADADGNFDYNSLTVASGYSCDVYKSTNGGAAWGSKTSARGGDKQWMIVDKTGGIGRSNIYAFWTYAYSVCPPGFFTRSIDGGSSYSECTEIPNRPFWGTMGVSRAGELYVCGWGDSSFVVAKSSSARDFNQAVGWDTVVPVSLDGSIMSGAAPNPGGIAGQTWLAVDQSIGQTQGYVYLLCSVQRHSVADPLDVMFSRSVDGGLTWSPPIRVNDDTTSTESQWFGTMSVAPNGRIDVVWLDTRDNPGTVLSSLYYSFSVDGGLSWSQNQRLSGSFDPHVGWPQQNKMGDYYHMVSDDSGAHLAWSATFNGEEDVYYGHISNTAGLNSPSYFMNRQWNLVSVPLIVADYRSTGIYPTASSSAYLYKDDGYHQVDTLANGTGYWLRFDHPQQVPINGVPVDKQSIQVHQGWNLIGSIGSPVPAANIISDPAGIVTSRFFAYDSSYVTVNVLQPGRGHWVKVNQDGSLTLISAQPAAQSISGASGTGASTESGRIVIVPTDELPPAPPDGISSSNPGRGIPHQYALEQNYPNPFNPLTFIRYSLPVRSHVTLQIYNLLGQEMTTLVNGIQDAGYQSAKFDASSRSSGMYFYKLEAVSMSDPGQSFTQVRKMLLTK